MGIDDEKDEFKLIKSIEVKIPEDLVIKSFNDLLVTKNSEESFQRIFVTREIVKTNGNDFVLSADEIIFEDSIIETFPLGTKAKKSNHGRHGGIIRFSANKLVGRVNVILRGEHAGEPSQPLPITKVPAKRKPSRDSDGGCRDDIDRCLTDPTLRCPDLRASFERERSLTQTCHCYRQPETGHKGHTGFKGNKANKGLNGGNSGSLHIQSNDASELKLTYKRENGLRSKNTNPGSGGKGGEGGESGLTRGSCKIASKGRTGDTGPYGDNISYQSKNGINEKVCLKLDINAAMECI